MSGTGKSPSRTNELAASTEGDIHERVKDFKATCTSHTIVKEEQNSESLNLFPHLFDLAAFLMDLLGVS